MHCILYCVGGAAYLCGIPFFLLGEYHPKYHVIWHIFVIAGASFHWFLTYFFILEVDIGLNLYDVNSVSNAFNIMVDSLNATLTA